MRPIARSPVSDARLRAILRQIDTAHELAERTGDWETFDGLREWVDRLSETDRARLFRMRDEGKEETS